MPSSSSPQFASFFSLLLLLSISLFLAILLGGANLVHAKFNTQAEENATIQEGDREYKTSKYFPDGSCAAIEGGKFHPPKKTSYSTVDFSKFKCLQDFHRAAMVPHCGDPWFDLKKYCAQVHFYKNKEIDQSWLKEEGNQDVVLVLLDGCFECKGNFSSVTLTLSYDFPDGSTFTKCSRETNVVSTIKIEKDKNETTTNGMPMSFTMAATFYQRKCMGLFSMDDVTDVYENIKLEVKHDCPSSRSKKMTVKLPNLDHKKVPKDRVAEFHFLHLNFTLAGKASKYDGPEGDSMHPVETAKWDLKPYWEKGN